MADATFNHASFFPLDACEINTHFLARPFFNGSAQSINLGNGIASMQAEPHAISPLWHRGRYNRPQHEPIFLAKGRQLPRVCGEEWKYRRLG